MSNPLKPESIDAIIAFQNTVAWSDLMKCAREALPRHAAVTAKPDEAVASAHRRAGAEEMLDLLYWLPRQPKEDAPSNLPLPHIPRFMDMSDDPKAATD